MFRPAEMSEVDIFVFENDVQDVARTVARLGVMHLLDVNALGKWAEDVSSEWSGRISTYTAQERRVRELLSQLAIEERTVACDDKVNAAEDLTAIEQQLSGYESSTQGLRERQASLRQELERRQLVVKSMETLAPLSVSISDLRQLQYLHLVAGTIPAENLARLEASLFRIPHSIIPLYHQGNRVLVFAFCAEEHAAILDRALESAFLDPLAFSQEFGGTALEVLAQVNRRVDEIQLDLADVEVRRAKLAAELAPQLLSLVTRIQDDRAIAEAMSHFGHRGRVYLIAGWVPKDRVSELRAAAEAVTSGRITFEENSPFMPGERRKVPTLLRNNWLFRPMEGLVATYGVPGYLEIDPTPLVAITFVLMFGIMFGDLGHGLVLATLGGLLALRLIPQAGDQSRTGAILLACGISSCTFGVLYGSVFGLDSIIRPLWLKPMKDIWALLEAAVIFGVVVLNIGFACRILTAWRQGSLVEAIFDKNGLVGLLLYWSLGGVVLMIATRHPLPRWLDAAVVLLLFALFLAEPLTNLVARKRPLIHGSTGEMAVQAFFELFEALISYVSNTLSYVRLGAFAVAHAGLTMVVFMLADMLGQGPEGLVIRSLVIVLGTLLVIGFEGLIVAIQTLRLEYYELFGKFFKGEGVAFKPLTLPDAVGKPYVQAAKE